MKSSLFERQKETAFQFLIQRHTAFRILGLDSTTSNDYSGVVRFGTSSDSTTSTDDSGTVRFGIFSNSTTSTDDSGTLRFGTSSRDGVAKWEGPQFRNTIPLKIRRVCGPNVRYI
ncbi:hypothetical protein AVEN_142616-1 [Araneus ventricosus]|uniref:Uncharacterized protein n=1 Tax=Araneus ventricosus TaxID=182803 RepID=A0A4Y2GA04_ARAVE|nr:hypothetical protein AVEN_142616-1 [Araneus ventricosus]